MGSGVGSGSGVGLGVAVGSGVGVGVGSGVSIDSDSAETASLLKSSAVISSESLPQKANRTTSAMAIQIMLLFFMRRYPFPYFQAQNSTISQFVKLLLHPTVLKFGAIRSFFGAPCGVQGAPCFALPC